MRKLVAFLILLLVLGVILDRVAVAGAQREIATRAMAVYDLDTPPEVTIVGVPFLTQAIAGRYDEVKVDAGAMSVAGVRLSSVDFTLYGITAPLEDLVLRADQLDMRAERVAGTVVIPVATLNQKAPQGIKVAVAGDGLNVDGEITVLGQKVSAKATMKIELVKDELRFTPEKVTLGEGIPVPQPERFIAYTIPIKNLPFDLKVTGVKVVPEGIEVSGEATDVPLHN
ncbi:DUF2993 domain-containing protein [Streptosporangium lutulentum]|uniref:DUF2993 domain-containing protein n=1 Tax=Streptosporangium lutulentum TaxID=1461250 RepID=A0ABT9QL17_9ACTN|nr:DUF2993 domain-containing protein [Streptosporangium lutulentum]MDP9846963.1 hypothetical protein [Streptosporangium lutulentum]